MLNDLITAGVALAITAILILATRRRPRGATRPRPARGELKMAKTLQVNGTSTATVAYTTKEGAPATVVGAPSWSVSPAGVIGLTPAADGLSAEVTAQAVGQATVTVTAEGDPTPGVDTITLTAMVTVVAEEASGGTITFS